MKTARSEPVAFSLEINPLLACLKEELAKGKDSVVERICDTIFQDLDRLCALARKIGVDQVRGVRNVSWMRVLDDPFAGEYIGLGLGQHCLDLGFLEESVAGAIRKRLEASSTAHLDNDHPSTIKTMTGPVRCDDWIYATPAGKFNLGHTYTWFIKKRVD